MGRQPRGAARLQRRVPLHPPRRLGRHGSGAGRSSCATTTGELTRLPRHVLRHGRQPDRRPRPRGGRGAVRQRLRGGADRHGAGWPGRVLPARQPRAARDRRPRRRGTARADVPGHHAPGRPRRGPGARAPGDRRRAAQLPHGEALHPRRRRAGLGAAVGLAGARRGRRAALLRLPDRGHHRAAPQRGRAARGRGPLPIRVRGGADRDGDDRGRRPLPAREPRACARSPGTRASSSRPRPSARSPTRTTSPRNERGMSEVLAGDVSHYRTEKRYIHADGHVVPVDLSSTVVRDADGEADPPAHPGAGHHRAQALRGPAAVPGRPRLAHRPVQPAPLRGGADARAGQRRALRRAAWRCSRSTWTSSSTSTTRSGTRSATS